MSSERSSQARVDFGVPVEPGVDSSPSITKPYAALPAPIRIADTSASVESEAPPDPTMGRDTERDFMLQNFGFV